MNPEIEQFLLELARQTNGDTSAQVSMYEIGRSLGLEKAEAGRIAQDLLGLMLAEIRTLSGGISLTEEGLEKIRELSGGFGADESDPTRALADGPIIDEKDRRSIETVSAALKIGIGNLGLDGDDLVEIVMDLRTLDVQLSSPRPKTAIVKACLTAVRQKLQKTPQCPNLADLDRLLGSAGK